MYARFTSCDQGEELFWACNKFFQRRRSLQVRSCQRRCSEAVHDIWEDLYKELKENFVLFLDQKHWKVPVDGSIFTNFWVFFKDLSIVAEAVIWLTSSSSCLYYFNWPVSRVIRPFSRAISCKKILHRLKENLNQN